MDQQDYSDEPVELESHSMQKAQYNNTEEEDDEEYLADVYEREGFDGFRCYAQPGTIASILDQDEEYMQAIAKWAELLEMLDQQEQKDDPNWKS